MTQQADAVRTACTDQVHRALARTSLGGIPASILLMLILGTSVPLDRRVGFVLLVACADVFMFFTARAYLAKSFAGERSPAAWLGPCGVAAIGAAWGSLAAFGLPDGRHVELRAVYLLFVCGCSATYVVGAAARRLYYFASQLPMLGLVGVCFLASGDRVTRLLGFAVPVYFVLMTVLHHEVHQLVISEVQLRSENEHATAELRSANASLFQKALRDELTGLANRSAFLDHLSNAVERARRRGTTIGVLYLDLDRFKVVNDSLGHAGGDALLIEVAQRLLTVMRSSDVVARLGGDEFTVLVDSVQHPGEPYAIAQRIADVFQHPFKVLDRLVHVTASIGLATNLYVVDDAAALLSEADAAQYEAKQAGRNRIAVFDVRMLDAIQRRLDDEQDLRSALTEGQIIAWYQPIVEISTGHITGAEALARWDNPERGILGAASFTTTADEAGLTYALDDTIISAAVRARARLDTARLSDDTFRIWCNVGDDQLTKSQPSSRLADLLHRAECNPAHIGIEITETAALSDLAAVAAEAQSARDLGVHVALDDFGTGHSSLTLLRTLPIDRLKIDRSFIQDITRQKRDATIVANVIALATDLGIEVIAEGVEQPEQARKLLELGCRYAQGYLWAKAQPLDEFEAELRARRHAVAVTPIASAAQGRSQALTSSTPTDTATHAG